MKFKIGDKVRMIRDEDAAACGWVGTIKGSLRSDSYAVEFEELIRINSGHFCNGLVPSGHGYWIHEGFIGLVEEEQKKTTTLTKETPNELQKDSTVSTNVPKETLIKLLVEPLSTNESPVSSPVIIFESQQQAEECLAYWQEKLFLNNWIIKVKLVESEEIEGCQGSDSFVHSLMSSLISISKYHEEGLVTKECHEQTLVHELLHLKYNLMDSDSKSYESTFLSMEEHRLLEQLARSLIMVKYDLSFGRFKNF